MFDSFRDKIQSVQEGITASLQRISVGDTARRCNVDDTVELNAGAELLHHYQTEWHNGHQQAEENAGKAQEIDAVIGEMHRTFEKQWSDITHLSSSVASAPQLITTTQALMEQLGELQEMFDEVEHNLLQLEDIIETQELQERQLDHRFQLALYKEKKLQELGKVRESLVAEYADKVVRHETRQRQTLKERQDTFGQAFQQDLELYKQSGQLPSSGDRKRSTTHRGPSLEEVTLDEDPVALDQFLGEECPQADMK